MDTVLFLPIPWQLKLAWLLLTGLVVTISMLAIPKSILWHIGTLPGLSPNWISFWRLPIFWIGVFVHFNLSFGWGYLIVVSACALDRIDGKVAVAMEEHGVIRSETEKEIGKWLDPLVDKLTLLPLIVIFMANGIIPTWLGGIIVLFDCIGTVMRKPLAWGAAFARKEEASAVGKVKVLLQCFGLIACMPIMAKWFTERHAPITLFAFAAVCGFVSLLSRIRIHQTFDRYVDSVGALFIHRNT